MALAQITGPVIAAGESLSAGLDCTQGTIVRLYTPDAWTPANVTFQLSFNGLVWRDLVDRSGHEVMAAITPGTVVILAEQMRVISFIRIRSGSRNQPVIQTAQRTFSVVVEK